jgi:3-oxoacyl-[acyl-carrier-protein] synthase-3
VAFLKTENTRISAIYTCVPQKIERTEDYEWISLQERQLFTKTTGIIERRVASESTTCSDLCFEAASRLLSDLNCKDEIDLVLFVSQSPDYFLPATSIILQNRLGIPTNAMAFDVNLGCSGYVYGLSIASHFIQSGNIKKVLLLAGDKSTISTNYEDKSTFPLFGDAGTATLLEFDNNSDDWFFSMASDGKGKDAIIIEHGHSRHPYGTIEDETKEIEPGIIRSKKHLKLNGMEVFNFALKEVAPSIKKLLNYSNQEIEEIDYFVFHQANKLINDSVRKKLRIEIEKVPLSIDYFGNTSSASIPLTICKELAEVVLKENKTYLLSGFGVGFSWATVLLNLSGVKTKMIEYA